MKIIKLPPPLKIETPLLIAIEKRRSRRRWLNKPLELEKLSTILWSAQGITDTHYGFRAAPSAGATYPLEIYIVASNVTSIESGIYHYNPLEHALEVVRLGNYSKELENACLNQKWVGSAPANIVITAVYARTTRYYGERGYIYVHIEVGHVGQNIYLTAEALGLGTVAVGAFYNDRIAKLLGVRGEEPLYVMPIGYPC